MFCLKDKNPAGFAKHLQDFSHINMFFIFSPSCRVLAYPACFCLDATG
jgi:hypothetical protein